MKLLTQVPVEQNTPRYEVPTELDPVKPTMTSSTMSCSVKSSAVSSSSNTTKSKDTQHDSAFDEQEEEASAHTGVILTEEEQEQATEFEFMNVKVTILGLSGITRERISKKKKKKEKVPSSMGGEDSVVSSGQSFQASTIASSSSLASGNSATTRKNLQNGPPIVATVVFRRNVTSNQTTIGTHIPSLPIDLPTSYKKDDRFMATWATEDQSFLCEQGSCERSSYSFSRVMKREPFMKADGRETNCSSNFSSETMDVLITLSKGKDIIPLGMASLVITGNEEGAELMNIPAKAVTFKKNKMVLGTQHKKSRARLFGKEKRSSFPSDPKTVYKLDENATLRVMVKVLPKHAVDAAKEAEDALFKQLKGTDLGLEDQENKLHANNEVAHHDNESQKNTIENSIFGPATTHVSQTILPRRDRSRLPRNQNKHSRQRSESSQDRSLERAVADTDTDTRMDAITVYSRPDPRPDPGPFSFGSLFCAMPEWREDLRPPVPLSNVDTMQSATPYSAKMDYTYGTMDHPNGTMASTFQSWDQTQQGDVTVDETYRKPINEESVASSFSSSESESDDSEKMKDFTNKNIYVQDCKRTPSAEVKRANRKRAMKQAKMLGLLDKL